MAVTSWNGQLCFTFTACSDAVPHSQRLAPYLADALAEVEQNVLRMMPVGIRDALVGRPAVGEWDPMFPLLTVDDAGFPHVCLLGRAELEADDAHLYAVLSSANTIANLASSRRATLIVIGPDAATYCKLIRRR